MPITLGHFNCSTKSGHSCKLLPFGFPYDLTGLGSINEPNQLRLILGNKPNNAFIYLSIFIGIYVIIFAIFLGIALSRSNLAHHHHSSGRKGQRNRRKKRKSSNKQTIVSFDETSKSDSTRTDLNRLTNDLYFV
ncbi:uncharacterized protein LOC128397608 [Panonychus citri]|uniref:uncharacterized protein LOC128397309 n=1 Tax=Panonychus citri TaxID=50023 RepID=UPI00230835F7|nr:uncharacterized protein LOC128397309 [Panonychus citri]XP_053214321.1 uncharacterized protein LOC128397608 [Panonychus citri]